jgi:uncharacterized protein (TIGR02246 family)
MPRCLIFPIIAALAVMTVGCNETAPATSNPNADTQTIKDIEAQWNKDFAAKDVDKLAAHYTDDAVLMNPGSPPAVGTDAIRKTLGAMVGDPAFSLTFQTTDVGVAKSGDLAYTHGTYQMKMTDPSTRKVVDDKGTYLTVYKKQADGSWKAVEDAAISEVPAPSPEAEKTKEHKKK